MVVEKKTNNDFGILLFQQKTIQDIYEMSGDLAEQNEFQFHYTALIGTYKIDNQTLNIAIPLVCYNYPQEVSGAYIGFNLKDVEELSNQLMPVAQLKAAEFLSSKDKTKLEEEYHIEEWNITPMMSIHRHPGGARQGFSGTDYDTNPIKPGIVYPFKQCNNSVSFSSIMYVQNNVCKIAHTEMRMVNGDVASNITYKHGRSATHVKEYKHEPTLIEQLLGVKNESVAAYGIEDGIRPGFVSVDFYPELFIDSENLSTRVPKQYFQKDLSLLDYNDRQEDYYAGIVDSCETDDDGLYCMVPETADKDDADELTELLRDELVLCTNLTDRDIARMLDEDIWKLSRDYGILTHNK